MKNKEIMLSKIAKTLSKPYLIPKRQYTLKKALKCSGLKDYYEKYSYYLKPYTYDGNYKKENERYDIFEGLDSIFSELFERDEINKITELLTELADLLSPYWINEKLINEF